MKTKKLHLSFWLTFIFVLSSTNPLLAQSPMKFSFQAVVRNASNQLVANQNVGVRISIISVVMGSQNPEYVEIHNTTTNFNGLFTIKVGTGTIESGEFYTAMTSNAQSKNIKCEIDPTGGTNYTIMSNEQMLSVPYALFANTAGSVNNNATTWSITGNSGTNIDTNFIGTSDFTDLKFKLNNENSGRIEVDDNTSNFLKNGNTALGYNSLFSNTIGQYNTSIGVYSLQYNTNGGSNVAVGNSALQNNISGNANVAIGAQPLFNNNTGFNNIGIGTYSMFFNQNGSENIALGTYSLQNANGASNTIAIGKNSMSNYLGQFNSGNTVAIGIETLKNQTTGFGNVALGSYSSNEKTSGDINTTIGYNSGHVTQTASNTICLGAGTGWASTTTNQVNIGNFLQTSIGGQVNWGTYSDKRIKNNIQENVPGLSFIKQLKPLTYNLDIQKQLEIANRGKKDDMPDFEGKYDIKNITFSGFLAQDVEDAAKNVGYNFSGVEAPKNGEGLYKLRYAEFVVPLVQAVKELSTENELLKQRNNDLELRLRALEEKISKL